jgi:protease II
MQALQPPVPEKRPVQITQHAKARTDNYQWMKDDDWQSVLEDPSSLKQDVALHLHAENAYHDATMSSTDSLKEAMFQEMKGRTKEDMSSAPFRDGPFDYYYRFETGAEHGIHCRKSVGTGVEEILLDEDAASKGKPFYEVSCAGHSPDHENFAWCERRARVVSFPAAHTHAACPPPRSNRPLVKVCGRGWLREEHHVHQVHRQPAAGRSTSRKLLLL